MMPNKTKNGWKLSDCGYYATKDEYTISKCFVGDKPKYTIWKNGKPTKAPVFNSFDDAKDSLKPKTNKDWEELGQQLGITPKVGEKWPKFKARIQEKINDKNTLVR